jgi:transcriptional regulator with XRE-family HTH domain
MIGKVIKQIRELKDIKQNALAVLCDISPTYLNYIEKETKRPSIDVLEKLSKALEIPMSILTFLSYEDNEVRYVEEYKLLVPIIDKLLLNLLKKKMNISSHEPFITKVSHVTENYKLVGSSQTNITEVAAKTKGGRTSKKDMRLSHN